MQKNFAGKGYNIVLSESIILSIIISIIIFFMKKLLSIAKI